MAAITIVFAALGFISPASRGMILTEMIFLYLFLGIYSGYVSVYLLRTIEGTSEGWSDSTGVLPIYGSAFRCHSPSLEDLWGQKLSKLNIMFEPIRFQEKTYDLLIALNSCQMILYCNGNVIFSLFPFYLPSMSGLLIQVAVKLLEKIVIAQTVSCLTHFNSCNKCFMFFCLFNFVHLQGQGE